MAFVELLSISAFFVSPNVLPRSRGLLDKNPFESFVNPAVFWRGFPVLALSKLSFLKVSFLRELGRRLISGRKDSFVLNDYVVFSISLFSSFVGYFSYLVNSGLN